MRHVSRTHRVALDWLCDRINLDPKIQITYYDIKNKLADIVTKGNFTRDEWNHLLSLFNISHFSSTVCAASMAKRIQQESGEERVTAKSRPMMNLTARIPTVVSSSTSSSLVKAWYEYQDPGKSVVVDDRSGQPDRPSPAGYSNSDYDRSWSSQEWKSEVTAHDRSGKSDKTSWHAVQQICHHHGDALLEENAHSVRYGKIIHDGSGQPDSANFQEETDSDGNFTRDEWNHLLCLFNINHFSSINSVKAMSKRTQEDAGEERVTAKSKSMTNLVSRCCVRDPTVLASTASENPGEHQI